jgi:aspartate racemase
MQGIYEGVKQGDMPLAVQCFGEALAPLLQRHGAVPVIAGLHRKSAGPAAGTQACGAELVDRRDTGLCAGTGRLRAH